MKKTEKIIVSSLMVLIAGVFILGYSFDVQSDQLADMGFSKRVKADRYALFITSLSYIIFNALFSFLSFLFRSKYTSWFITINYIIFTIIIIMSIMFVT